MNIILINMPSLIMGSLVICVVVFVFALVFFAGFRRKVFDANKQ